MYGSRTLLWALQSSIFYTRVHYSDVIKGAMTSHHPHDCLLNRLFRRRTTNTPKLYTSLAFVRGIHRWPVNSPHKWPVTRNIFPFDDVIILLLIILILSIPKIVYMCYALPCNAVVVPWSNLPLSFRVVSLALGQSYDCPSASEAALKNMGKYTM